MLECKDLRKHYAGVYALKGVDFRVQPGEVHALCGENGAGKSTLAKILAGVVTPDEGTVFMDGQPIVLGHPTRARRLGIGIVFQELDLFEHLTVAENMMLGNDGPAWVRRGAMDAFCRPYLRKVGLDISPRALLGDIGIAAAQLVAIARSLSMQAKVLLLDEPTSSLTEEAAERLLALVLQLKQAGTGIAYVSHKMKEIFQIADRVTVLRDGELVSNKPAAETSIEETIRLMVGRAVDLSARIESQPRQEVAFSVRGLCSSRLKEVSFSVRRGEVLGIAGLVGSGRSSLGETLFGLHRWDKGEAACGNRKFHPRHPREAIREGFAYLPEDRRSQGLFLHTSVRHNASSAVLNRLSRAGFVMQGEERRIVADELAQTRTKAAADTLPVSALSGGNQQKVLLAKWLLPHPEVLFLDDPTRGVDVGAKADFYGIIEGLASQGKAIVMASSELLELLRCTHRIMVMNNGRVAGILDTASATQEQIMALAAGHQPAASLS